ncbi:hypothetical protein SynPROS91_02637 [Synechococcus sp. PROS-9-1]|nr:hypothetical protein SynPROS91_02637 [Synechococcus sp. PROS-9-1]
MVNSCFIFSGIAVERNAQSSWLDPVMLAAHLGQISTEPCFQHENVL